VKSSRTAVSNFNDEECMTTLNTCNGGNNYLQLFLSNILRTKDKDIQIHETVNLFVALYGCKASFLIKKKRRC
jgi:hypothetical protein